MLREIVQGVGGEHIFFKAAVSIIDNKHKVTGEKAA